MATPRSGFIHRWRRVRSALNQFLSQEPRAVKSLLRRQKPDFRFPHAPRLTNERAIVSGTIISANRRPQGGLERQGSLRRTTFVMRAGGPDAPFLNHGRGPSEWCRCCAVHSDLSTPADLHARPRQPGGGMEELHQKKKKKSASPARLISFAGPPTMPAGPIFPLLELRRPERPAAPEPSPGCQVERPQPRPLEHKYPCSRPPPVR